MMAAAYPEGLQRFWQREFIGVQPVVVARKHDNADTDSCRMAAVHKRHEIRRTDGRNLEAVNFAPSAALPLILGV